MWTPGLHGFFGDRFILSPFLELVPKVRHPLPHEFEREVDEETHNDRQQGQEDDSEDDSDRFHAPTTGEKLLLSLRRDRCLGGHQG